jgi:ribosomal protein S18 acetylase RimI-like enzyme
MTPADFDRVIDVWRESKRVAYTFLPVEQSRLRGDDEWFFREHIASHCDIWLAELDRAIVAFMAIDGSYVDRLYVHPSHQRSGIGTALIAKAKVLSPAGLELHTHQKNVAACAFYERHGFRAVKFGVSPPPESEPDVEYHWRP